MRARAARVQPPRAGARRDGAAAIAVRRVRRDDLAQVIAIDAMVTGVAKADYWRAVFRRYGGASRTGRHFLVAEVGDDVVGFVIGEVRDWEFGSPPCGWVFGIDVRPDRRLAGVGARLLVAICARFREAGIGTVRTLLARDNALVLSFFRSQGMMAGPFIPLEMDL
ncbi:MAG TPA: GNAT family N-acetyltransferase [Caldimonas sp.]|nr:GNAT family N-acetyltransferase [Caldimonas sp.]